MKIKKRRHEKEVFIDEKLFFQIKCQLCKAYSLEFTKYSDKPNKINWHSDTHYDYTSTFCGITQKQKAGYIEDSEHYDHYFYVFCPKCMKEKVIPKINELNIEPETINTCLGEGILDADSVSHDINR